MSIEAGKLKEEEKKKKKLTEEDKLKIEKGVSTLKELKIKEEYESKEEKENAESSMDELLNLVEKGVISKETAKNFAEGKEIDEDTIKEIFEKIDEIEDLKDVDKYLPEELRISRDEYIKAVNDDIFRVQTITKLDSALTLLSNQINPDSITGMNLFSGFIAVLDKNLIKIQENTLDVKDSLKDIDEKKFGKKEDNRIFIQKILDFIKEIFN